MPTPESGLVTRTVPKVTGGVSQRSPVVRDLSECSELINVIPDPTFGVMRRPASQYNYALSGFNEAHYLYTFQFSANEKYALFIKNGGLTVVDLINKTEMTVNVESGAAAYLSTLDPAKDFQAMTVGNETFVLNRSVVTAEAADLSDADENKACVWVRLGDNGTRYSITLDGTEYDLTTSATSRAEIDTRNIALGLRFLIPQGICVSRIKPVGAFVAGDSITVTDTVSGKTSTFTVFPRLVPPTVIPEDIAPEIQGVSFFGSGGGGGNLHTLQDVDLFANWIIGDELIIVGATYVANFSFTVTTTSHLGSFVVTNLGILPQTYDAVVKGSSLIINKHDNSDFSLSVSDGLGNQALEAFKGSLQSFSDLPANASEGFKVRITGDLSSETDDFYVKYTETATPDDSGVWQESLKGNELTSLDATTMPHLLVPHGDGTWDFGKASWNTRAVGDLSTNPMPSFVDSPINDMFFFKNRLGFVSGENKTLSQAGGNYFSLFRRSVAQLLDEDRIDVSSNSAQVNKIKFATFQDHELILWGDEGQIAVTGSPLLTPKTVSENPAGKFKTSEDVKPVPAGKFTYFLTERTGTTQVSEYFSVDAAQPRKEIVDLTENIPTYIDGVPVALAASDANGMIFVGAKSEPIT